MRVAVFLLANPLIVLLGLAPSTGAGDDAYRREIERWRQKREAELKADDGWLAVTGLYWLRPGETTIGSDPSRDLLLPARVPGLVGILTVADGQVAFKSARGAAVTCNGRPFDNGPLHSDADENPDALVIGDIKLLLLKRGTRLAVRIKDRQSPLRAGFRGLRWYPPQENWRIEAKFVSYPEPTKLRMDTIVGETEWAESPGYVTFEHEGKSFILQAAGQKSGELWFVFRDGTSGRTTHGGARQLYAGPAREGIVVLDFNKAVNLPCAYIPFATCPLAPARNRLSLAIEAGEKKYEIPGSERTADESGR